MYIYLNKLYSNNAKGFFLNHSVWKCTFKLLWYWFRSLFSALSTKQKKTNANMANASLHLFRNKCCRVFTLSYFCVLFVVSFIARSPFRHKRQREQLTVKEWSFSWRHKRFFVVHSYTITRGKVSLPWKWVREKRYKVKWLIVWITPA